MLKVHINQGCATRLQNWFWGARCAGSISYVSYVTSQISRTCRKYYTTLLLAVLYCFDGGETTNTYLKIQECIPVGCVPPASVAVSPATHPRNHTCPPCHVHTHTTPPPPCLPLAMHAPPPLPSTPSLPHMPPPCTPPLLWTEGMTHTCENITLPKTPFAGGNNISLLVHFVLMWYQLDSHRRTRYLARLSTPDENLQ